MSAPYAVSHAVKGGDASAAAGPAVPRRSRSAAADELMSVGGAAAGFVAVAWPLLWRLDDALLAGQPNVISGLGGLAAQRGQTLPRPEPTPRPARAAPAPTHGAPPRLERGAAPAWPPPQCSPGASPRQCQSTPATPRLTVQVLAWMGALLGALAALALSDVARCYFPWPPTVAPRRKIAAMASEGSTRPSEGKL